MGPGSTSYRKGVSPMLFYTDCKTNRRPEAQHRERPNLLAALAVLAACASSRQTLAASFDCQRASTRLEVMICSDPTLSALDDQLDAGYKAADARHAVPALREEQRAWLAQRARCADAACLGDMYRHRVVDLSAIAAAASPAVRTRTSGRAGGRQILRIRKRQQL